MKEYFILQYKMANRKIIEIGFNPLLGYLLCLLALAAISEYVFRKSEFAGYAVLLIAFSLLLRLSEKKRIEFLKVVFGDKKFRSIRIVENILLIIPFSILLLYHKAFLEAVLLLLSCPLLAFNSFNINYNFSLPTPFYKNPYEFTTGFRKTFYIFPLAYILTYLAISVNNFNLGIFALLFVFLVTLTFHIKPENEYFVWSYSTKPSKFLFKKIKTATIYSTLLVLPIILSMVCFFPVYTKSIIMFSLIGFAFLWTVILAKYSAYPNEINIPEGILFALCIYFPPLLIALIPFFYVKSIKKLNLLLK